eukprot:6185718-Pleurochrysis_carterae.AAC.1
MSLPCERREEEPLYARQLKYCRKAPEYCFVLASLTHRQNENTSEEAAVHRIETNLVCSVRTVRLLQASAQCIEAARKQLHDPGRVHSNDCFSCALASFRSLPHSSPRSQLHLWSLPATHLACSLPL